MSDYFSNAHIAFEAVEGKGLAGMNETSMIIFSHVEITELPELFVTVSIVYKYYINCLTSYKHKIKMMRKHRTNFCHKNIKTTESTKLIILVVDHHKIKLIFF